MSYIGAGAQRPEEGHSSPAMEIAGSYELPDVGTGNQTRVLCKSSSKCSSLLSHLCNPCLLNFKQRALSPHFVQQFTWWLTSCQCLNPLVFEQSKTPGASQGKIRRTSHRVPGIRIILPAFTSMPFAFQCLLSNCWTPRLMIIKHSKF